MRFLFIFFLFITSSLLGQDSLSLKKSDSILMIAKSQLGVPYKYATSKPGTSFDCSGFTSYVYSSCNVKNSRSSKSYSSLGESVDLKNAKPGDCILFTGTDASIRKVGHVGIVVENNEKELLFIHCSSSKKHFGVVITDYYNSGYPKRFMDIRRMYSE